MAIAALSNAGFTQYVAASSHVSASQQALQALGQSLAAGNLSAAQSAFASYQGLNQSLANASGTGSGTAAGSASQLTTDLNTLGTALSGGDLTTARQAFATVQSDLKSAPSPAVTNAENAVAQTVGWVDDLLTLSGSSGAETTTVDPTTQILNSAYGLNPSSNSDTTDPTAALLESAYGVSSSGSTAGSSGTTGNDGTQGSGVSGVNVSG
jgi:hypothetical protein